MPNTDWQVILHEARTQDEFLRSKIAADKIDGFAVQASHAQQAKAAARTWLESRGHVVRSLNVLATEANTLVAYVAAGSAAKSKAFLAGQAQHQLAARARR
jgi:hypothetical protein